jgi:hypothetical protein
LTYARPHETTLGELAWAIAATGATGLLWWSYAGPYRWVAGIQIRLFGACYAGITGIVVFLIFALPGRFLLRGGGGFWSRTVEWSPTGSWLYAVGAVPLAIGIYLHAASARMDHKEVTVEMLEQAAPPSRWLTVTAVLRPEAARCRSGAGRRTPECFVPLVSESWTPDSPVGLFLKTHCHAEAVPLTGPYTGTLSYLGLPGPLRDALQREGAIGLRGALVMDWNEGPESIRMASYFFIGAGVFAGLVGFAGRFPRLTRDWRG